ncbi:MFS transporter [Balneola sp. MJW-20]|uniref:MFS transporter n=1 Tax=Gracilimonas aurantiaca TaxID=3234185 RepID=UPI0034675DF7
MRSATPKHVLPVIVIAQFAGTSLWFAGNAVVPDLIRELGLLEAFIGFITMAVQAGFITGTLLFAALSVADRFSPVKVFLLCSVLGAAANLLTIWSDNFTEVMFARLFTGFFLAGIYPVGMKIASDWHKEGLGKALGYLVGALVLGTAFPHLLKYLGGDLPWRFVMISTSLISLSGGVLLYFTVNDGPYKGKAGVFKPSAMFRLFRDPNFRSAAFGYFGHMWELYTFWAFVPVILAYLNSVHTGSELNVSLFSFLIIGIGALSCAIGGHLSLKKGSKKVALSSLMISGGCCLLLPLISGLPLIMILLLLFLWGITVIPDSPQFSTLVAKSSDPSYVATGLTIVNSIGFAITIISIQLINFSWLYFENLMVFWLILPGPILGLLSIRKYQNR